MSSYEERKTGSGTGNDISPEISELWNDTP